MNYHQKEPMQPLPSLPPSQLSVSSIQQTTIPFLQNLPISLDWTHQILDQHCCTLSNHSQKVINHLKPSVPMTPIISCNPSATNIPHHCYSHTTIPPVYLPNSYIGLPCPNGMFLSKCF